MASRAPITPGTAAGRAPSSGTVHDSRRSAVQVQVRGPGMLPSSTEASRPTTGLHRPPGYSSYLGPIRHPGTQSLRAAHGVAGRGAAPQPALRGPGLRTRQSDYGSLAYTYDGGLDALLPWSVLEDQVVLVRSEATNLYCEARNPDPRNVLTRVMADMPRAKAVASKSAHFMVRRYAHGYRLQSLVTGVQLHNYGWVEETRLLADSPHSRDAQRLSEEAPCFLPAVFGQTAEQLADGNYAVRTPLMGVLANEVARRPEERAAQRVDLYYAAPADNPSHRVLRGELLVRAARPLLDILRTQLSPPDPSTVFVIETLHPPDRFEWLSDPANKLACCRGLAGPRTESSCAHPDNPAPLGSEGARSLCDQLVRDWCTASRESSGADSGTEDQDAACACFDIQKLAAADDRLADYGYMDLVGCTGACSAAAAYKTARMIQGAEPAACRDACSHLDRMGVAQLRAARHICPDAQRYLDEKEAAGEEAGSEGGGADSGTEESSQGGGGGGGGGGSGTKDDSGSSSRWILWAVALASALLVGTLAYRAYRDRRSTEARNEAPVSSDLSVPGPPRLPFGPLAPLMSRSV